MRYKSEITKRLHYERIASNQLFKQVKHLENRIEYYKTAEATHIILRNSHDWVKFDTNVKITKELRKIILEQLTKKYKLALSVLNQRRSKFNK